MPGEARELFLRLLHIVRQNDVVVIIERAEEIVGGQDLEAELRELELADHLRVQQAHDVGEDREGEARHDLLGHGGAADDVAALEDERLQPRLGEVGAADQAVVPAADDDRVVDLRHATALRFTLPRG